MMLRATAVAMFVLAFGGMHAVDPARLRADEKAEQAAVADAKSAEIGKILAAEAVVPDGVVYKKTTAEQNRKAIDKLSKTFLAADVKELPDDLLPLAMICGAGLWRNIKDDAEMKKIEAGRAVLHVPTEKGMQEAEGKIFQSNEELASFWRALRRKYKLDAKANIRRPTSDELGVYWSMIPFDITEPIFMIETKDAVILAHFSDKDLKIAWIDDVKNMRLPSAK